MKEPVGYPAIRDRVERMGVKITRLERLLDLSNKSLNDRLDGRLEFTLTEALTLAGLFGVSVEELAGKPSPGR